VEKYHPGTTIHTAALDRELNARKYILPAWAISVTDCMEPRRPPADGRRLHAPPFVCRPRHLVSCAGIMRPARAAETQAVASFQRTITRTVGYRYLSRCRPVTTRRRTSVGPCSSSCTAR